MARRVRLKHVFTERLSLDDFRELLGVEPDKLTTFRDELLNGEVFYSLREAQIIIEEWRKHYNTKRPHSALGYRPPARETIVPMDQRPVMH